MDQNSKQPIKFTKLLANPSLRIAAIYLLLGMLWILVSDQLLALLTSDPQMLTWLQSYKGWFYVLITAHLVYLLLRNRARHVWKMELALRENEERLKSALESAQEGIWDWNITSGEVVFSEQWAQMLGYQAEEIPPNIDFWKGIIHPDDRSLVERALSDHLNNETPFYEAEYRMLTKSGFWIWIQDRSHVVKRDSEGRPLRLTGVHRDVTNRKAAEIALRKSHRALTVLSQGNRALVMARDEGSLLHEICQLIVVGGQYRLAWIGEVADTEAESQLLRLRSHFISGEIAEIDPYEFEKALHFPPYCEALHEHAPSVVRNFVSSSASVPLRECARKYGFNSILALPLISDEHLYGILAIHAMEKDAFAEAEIRLLSELADNLAYGIRALRTQAERAMLVAAIEQAAESVFITDERGTIQYVNPAFEQLCGYSRDDILGKNPRILKSGEQSDQFYRQLWQTISSGQVWRGIITNRRKDGTTYQKETAISPVRDHNGKISNYVSVSRDITEERKLEIRLRQAQKMEAIGTLAGGIAHDFNNILSAIIGYTEMAIMGLKRDSEAYANLEEVMRAARRAADLVRQILTFSRKSEMHKRPLLLQPIVKEALKLMRGTMPSTIEIATHIDETCGPVFADATQIHQVLVNLCTNAYQAMQEKGGLLEIGLSEVSLVNIQNTDLFDLAEGRYACLAIKDTGCGMDEATKSRLFEPYFTTKEIGKGTGLGLPTVHGIVKECNGAILVESALGLGTTFQIYLPISSAAVEEISPPRGVADIPGGNERILFIDDEEAIARLGKIGLESLGYQVTAHNRSDEALRQFQENPDAFDLIITDLTMPKMTGVILAREIWRLRPLTPIILITGNDDNFNQLRAHSIGFARLLAKPIQKIALASVIREVLDDRARKSPADNMAVSR